MCRFCPGSNFFDLTENKCISCDFVTRGFLENGICKICEPKKFFSQISENGGVKNECTPCDDIKNGYLDQEICKICGKEKYFDETTRECKECNTVNRGYLENGVCTVCGSGKYFDNVSKKCVDNLITNGLVEYYDGDSIVGTTWNNKVGTNNINIFNPSGISRSPINGKYFINIPTNTGFLLNRDIDPNNYTLIYVIKSNGTSRASISFGGSSYFLTGLYYNKIVSYQDMVPVLHFSNNLNTNINNWTIGVDTKGLLRINKNTVGTYDHTSTNTFNKTFKISVNLGTNIFSDLSIACILLYNRRLSSDEITNVENYLSAYYNL